LAQGFERGDRLGILAPNCAEWIVTQYAAAKAGLILVNINPAYRVAELEVALNMVSCKAIIVAPKHKGSDYVAMLRELAPELNETRNGTLSAARLPSLRRAIVLGLNRYAGFALFDDIMHAGERADREELQRVERHLLFDDPINIQFTSGTTGFPKGAVLSHHNVLNNGYFVGEAIRLRCDERLCAPVPLYHCFGMVMANLACLTHGACVVYPAESFDPLSVLQALSEERCAALYGVPTMFVGILNHPEFGRFDLTSLRTGIMAGAPCPAELMNRVVERMHMPEITIAYGMTETSPVSFQSSIDDPLDRRVSSVGRVQPHIEAKIVSAEGVVVERGQAGELCTRGYSVMLGYWDDSERTAEVLDAAGWMHTGDLATLDEAGYCNVVGRLKDMVIRGGENIYPREIEEFLFRHPAVQDVQVIGVPDSKYGEELCAWIIVNAGYSIDAEAIQEFCKGRIAHYKIPRLVKVVQSFPMTVSGKVRKVSMREAMIAELGISVDKAALSK
jgi:fatty-acyl-CoA synthase